MSGPSMRDVARAVKRMGLAAFSAALSELPRNDRWWTYTIFGFDQSPYLTRTLMPRVGDKRLLLHRIWRPDYDSNLHNHPWKTASFYILSGGYTEERLVDDEIVRLTYRAGDVNRLDWSSYHRIDQLEPHTWTLGLVGERIQDWGFLVEGTHVPHAEFFARKNHIARSESLT